MHPDTARTCSAYVFVLSIIGIILLGATGCRDFEAYVATLGLAIMAAFVGSTQD